MLRRLRFEVRYLVGDAPWDSGESPPELLEFLAAHPAGRAIDLGCGTGTNSITIAKHGWQVIGIDQSFVAIAKARRKAGRSSQQVHFVRGDAAKAHEHPAIDGPFDLALDLGCLHTLAADRRPDYAAGLRSLLSAGGTYLLYSFLQPPDKPDSRWPAEANIRSLLETGFELMGVEHGSYHERLSAWFTYRRLSS
ncbi:MAG: class I SAM-dependent methyltransferase [Anaerolineales bacterium]